MISYCTEFTILLSEERQLSFESEYFLNLIKNAEFNKLFDYLRLRFLYYAYGDADLENELNELFYQYLFNSEEVRVEYLTRCNYC